MPKTVRHGKSKTKSHVNGTMTKKEVSKARKNNVGCAQKASAVLTRLLFLLHTGIALWRVSLYYPLEYLYFLGIGVFLLLLEMIFTLAVRQGKEYKWFCPSVFFYLASVVPCLWFLELNQMNTKLHQTVLEGGCRTSMQELTNVTMFAPTSNVTDLRVRRDAFELESDVLALPNMRVKRQNVDSNDSKSNQTKRKRKRKNKRRKNKRKNRKTNRRPKSSTKQQHTFSTLAFTTSNVRLINVLSVITSKATLPAAVTSKKFLEATWTLAPANKADQSTHGVDTPTHNMSGMLNTTQKVAVTSQADFPVAPSILTQQNTEKYTPEPVQAASTIKTLLLESQTSQQPNIPTSKSGRILSVYDSSSYANMPLRETTKAFRTSDGTAAFTETTTKEKVFPPDDVTMGRTTTASNTPTSRGSQRLTAVKQMGLSFKLSAFSTSIQSTNSTVISANASVAQKYALPTKAFSVAKLLATTSSPQPVKSTTFSSKSANMFTSVSTPSSSTQSHPNASPPLFTDLTSTPAVVLIVKNKTNNSPETPMSSTTRRTTTTSTAKKNNIKEFGHKISKFGNEAIHYLQNTTATVNAFLNGVNPENWLLGLHQVLLFVLVIGRWLLPKGKITRDQLSQLLLVFIGVGADILEFVTETIDDDVVSVRCNRTLHFIIYGVWSWSLLQFTLVLTAAKSRKTRVGFDSTAHVTMVKAGSGRCAKTIFNNADLWGILVTMLLQDVPFLAFRLYVMIEYNQVHQMMVFFTGKNFLVVILQIYRLVVLQTELKNATQDEVTDAELQPLKGTLRRLTLQARPEGIDSNGDIQGATFKSRKDGSVVVKIELESESSTKRKRKQSQL